MGISSKIIQGAEIALVDRNSDLDGELKPSFIYNNIDEGVSVKNIIVEELRNCEEFWFSSAFVTKHGIQLIKNALDSLRLKGKKGRILTTTYLLFNDADTFEELLKFENIEVRISEEDFHTKGYMFYRGDNLKVFLVGSSNLTSNALKKNLEWNIKINSMSEGEIINDVENEFSKIWEKSVILTPDWIKGYREVLKSRKKKIIEDEVIEIESYKLKPNKMQASALVSLDNLRKKEKDKAILISATGTGKTYLSAFDVRNFGAKKVLFVAHREQILRQSLKSYKKVLSNKKNMVILSSQTTDKSVVSGSDVVFATIQTLSKDVYLKKFSVDYFDYIVIDESHRAGASSYRKVIEYFRPKFLLGMTATPERTDNDDIFKLFDHNIAYEVRLKDAMKNNLLCPFCYFGIADVEVDDEEVSKELYELNRDETKVFNYLTSDERVRHIDEKIRFYGYSGDRLRGLMFVSSVKEGENLSKKLNEIGYRTVFLSGKNTEKEREDAIRRLEETNKKDDYLDYIITRDIFNEGVDIPSINQVVMLRPTQSAIIFVQQLGRGLRKFENKDFVTVIDFIGNYSNNYMIPIALSGDRSMRKHTLRYFVGNVSNESIGMCNIEFDRITEQRIYNSIDNANFNYKKEIERQYTRLKNMIGKIPNILDFDEYGEIDPLKLFDTYSKLKINKVRVSSYHKALKCLDKDYNVEFNEFENYMLDLACKRVVNSKRACELVMLKNMILHKENFLKYTAIELFKKYRVKLNDKLLFSSVQVLCGNFETTEGEKAKSKRGSFFDLNLIDIDKSVEAGFLVFNNINSINNTDKSSIVGNDLIGIGNGKKSVTVDNDLIGIDNSKKYGTEDYVFRNYYNEDAESFRYNIDDVNFSEVNDSELFSNMQYGFLRDKLCLSKNFVEALSNELFVKELLYYVRFGIKRFEEEYNNKYKDTDLCLGRTYKYDDVCRILRWNKNVNGQNIGGYKYDDLTNTFPVFINYHKSEDINSSIAYEDEFLDRSTLKAISKSKRNADSKDIKRIYDQKNNNMKIYLFVRKNNSLKGNADSDPKEFYFLGEMFITGEPKVITMPNTNITAVEMVYKLEQKVDYNLYNYIVNK